MTGDIKRDDAYTLATVVGRQQKTPALVHRLLKQQDLVEFVMHEAWLFGGVALTESVAAIKNH